MIQNLHKGAASISFNSPIYFESCASIVSQKEGEGPFGNLFDMICEDPMFGCDTWEAAESTLQKEAATLAINRCGLMPEDVQLMFAGDLLAQTAATCFGSAGIGIPFYGLYGACSTMGESLSLGSLALTAGFRKPCSMHNLQSFCQRGKRVPLSTWIWKPAAFFCNLDCHRKRSLYLKYRSSRGKSPLRSSCGCAAITGLTAGRVMDYGLKDSMNMGGCMAPAACDTIARNFADFGRSPSDYDAVFTGDLGMIGKKILLDLLNEQNIDLACIHQDCGILIYDSETQDTHAGGSGCGCSATVFAAYILPKVVCGEWKRILLFQRVLFFPK